MLTVMATILAQPAHADALAAVMTKLAAASRKEAGCSSYRVFRCSDDPALFHTFEQWADAAAEVGHMASAHIGEAFAAAGPMLAAAPDIRKFAEI
jgi:quinol monooxygenase YgiN